MVLNFSIFCKFPAPAGEFALRQSPLCPSVDLRLALTFVLWWTFHYLLGLWYWFSPTTLVEAPPSISTSFSSLALSVLLWIISKGLSPLAAKVDTKNFVQTPSRKENLGECPSRRLKPLDSWRCKKYGNKGKRNKETFLEHPFVQDRVYRNRIIL